MCATLVDSSQEVRAAIVELYSASRAPSPTLKYLNNVEEEEIKEYQENCGTDDYYSANTETVMADLPQPERALCPFRTYVETDPQVCFSCIYFFKSLFHLFLIGCISKLYRSSIFRIPFCSFTFKTF